MGELRDIDGLNIGADLIPICWDSVIPTPSTNLFGEERGIFF